MCFYLQKIRNIEILSMKCEFIQDQNDIIWLSHVSDILCRPKKQSFHEMTLLQNLANEAKEQRERNM